MGICSSSQAVNPKDEERKKNAEIQKVMATDDAKEREINKLLLLGPGESGKSTLFKQMVSLYGKGFTEEDRRKYLPLIHTHVLNSIKTLVKQSDVLAKKGIQRTTILEKNQESKVIIEELKDVERPLEKGVTPHMAKLWADPGIQTTFEHRAMYYLTDSAGYFLEKVESLAVNDYVPSEQDIFRCRTRSTGILEEEFKIEGSKFKMVDVGGQRNERKKWIHCFSEVTAILFVVGMSEYDMVLFEDAKTNRMHEALNVFEDVVNNKHMSETPVMLFLNKRDLFAEKIHRKVPLRVAFPDFVDNNPTVESATSYIRQQFEKRNKNSKRPIYTHVTCATDTDNVKFVFTSVKDILIRGALVEGGLALPK